MFDRENIELASKYYTSLNLVTFRTLLSDLKALAEAELVVCTFSSNVCRYVYELMQSKNDLIDPHFKIRSLDRHFYADSFNTFTKLAILNHEPKDAKEIEIKKGDIMSIFCSEDTKMENVGNLWNGYMKGTNLRTKKFGLFPAYKVINYYTRTKDLDKPTC